MLYNIGPREDEGEENVSSSMDVHPGANVIKLFTAVFYGFSY